LLNTNLKCKIRPNKAIILLRKSIKGFLKLYINLECEIRPSKAIMLLKESIKGFLKLCKNYNSSYIIFILS
jgi:hypothetical protein